jgi:hypothetical protein
MLLNKCVSSQYVAEASQKLTCPEVAPPLTVAVKVSTVP